MHIFMLTCFNNLIPQRLKVVAALKAGMLTRQPLLYSHAGVQQKGSEGAEF